MGFEHSLSANITFKPGITTQAALLAFDPLAKECGWTEAQMLDNSLPCDDTIIVNTQDGYAVNVQLYTCGEVPHSYRKVVQEFAGNLAELAEVGFIELGDHDTGDLSNAISTIWYGSPADIERKQQAHAWCRAVDLLTASGVPEASIKAVRDAASSAEQATEVRGAIGNHRIKVPEDVRLALVRMCSPLDPSRLAGVTAREDARCMALIKAFIEQLCGRTVGEVASGVDLAEQFWDELLMETESLTAIAELYGTETLADCMYLQNAVMKDSFIDNEGPNAASKIIDLVKTLPSAEKWMTFIHID